MNNATYRHAVQSRETLINTPIEQALPTAIINLVANGILKSTRKRTYQFCFFVKGVDKGRVIWDEILQTLLVSHHLEIPNPEQRARFRDVFYELHKQLEQDRLTRKNRKRYEGE